MREYFRPVISDGSIMRRQGKCPPLMSDYRNAIICSHFKNKPSLRHDPALYFAKQSGMMATIHVHAILRLATFLHNRCPYDYPVASEKG
jgi:hypothetical protein